MRKITPYGRKFEKLANDMARSYSPTFYACRKCSYPVMDGYCCNFCGSTSPSTTKEDDREYERLVERRVSGRYER